MNFSPRAIASLSLAALIGAGATACDSAGDNGTETSAKEAVHNSDIIAADTASFADGVELAALEEVEIENSYVPTGDPVDDDAEYYFRLGLIHGHLTAFIELYRAGETALALVHVKHPQSDSYQALAPAFAARGADGFANELSALSDAAARGGDIEALFAATVFAINENVPEVDAKVRLLTVARLANAAAEAFTSAVDASGQIVAPYEYQDAYGFLVVAREILSAHASGDINDSDMIAIAHEQIDVALLSFEGLTAANTEGMSETIYSAASRIEDAANRL